jgi:hypothetical protein
MNSYKGVDCIKLMMLFVTNVVESATVVVEIAHKNGYLQ